MVLLLSICMYVGIYLTPPLNLIVFGRHQTVPGQLYSTVLKKKKNDRKKSKGNRRGGQTKLSFPPLANVVPSGLHLTMIESRPPLERMCLFQLKFYDQYDRP